MFVVNNKRFSHGRDGKVVLWDTNTLKQVESFAIGSYTFNKVAPIRWPCEGTRGIGIYEVYFQTNVHSIQS